MATIAEAMPGAVFGELTILSTHRKAKHLYCICACSCGNIKDIYLYSLGRVSKTCGHNVTLLGLHSTVSAKTRTYNIWKGMFYRTSEKALSKPPAYRDKAPPLAWFNYGNFLADMGECPEGMTLERIDTRKPYGPTNCVWATRAEQVRNREYVRFFKKGEEILTLVELSIRLGLSQSGLRHRLKSRESDPWIGSWKEITYAEMRDFIED